MVDKNLLERSRERLTAWKDKQKNKSTFKSPQPCQDRTTAEEVTAGDGQHTQQRSGMSQGDVRPVGTFSRAEASASHTSSRTPIWSRILNKWSRKNPKAYQALVIEAEHALDEPSNVIGALNDILGNEKSTGANRVRLRRYQATLTSARGMAMSFASLDPHKIAPIVVASVFFSIDVSS